MKTNTEKPKFLTIPKGFIPHRGKSSYDMAQELWRYPDRTKIHVVRRNGEIDFMCIMDINWYTTFLKTDVVGYEPPKKESENEEAAGENSSSEAGTSREQVHAEEGARSDREGDDEENESSSDLSGSQHEAGHS